MSAANYRLYDPVSDATEKELLAYEPLVRQLLANRGISTAEAAQYFLEPNYNEHLNDPFLMRDMEKAVERILLAIKNNERIAIYSDYDCDGIPGAVVLHDFFKKIEYENFTNYIPHRHYEGFGFNVGAVEKLQADGVSLVVTIDCGSTDGEAIDLSNTLDIDVIVTDHHEIPKEEPAALALVNPKVEDEYPFDALCGAGVVYKLVQALIAHGDFAINEGWEKWLLDMVGVATIADMVPLVGENRVLARYGLTVLRKSRRPGVQHLFKSAKASQQHATEDDVGFTLGPRINAASRMDAPEDAFNALVAVDEETAGAAVKHLEGLNLERKSLVAVMTKELKKRIKTMEAMPPVLVMGNPEWRPSLVGLSANSLSEEYNRPVFVWGRDGNGIIKGSCRSDGAVSVIALMEHIAPELLEHGGHHMAGGFAVEPDKIHALSERLNQAFADLGEIALVDSEHVVDAELTLEQVNGKLLQQLAKLAPFGTGNEKPLFKFSNITPTKVDLFGKTKEHTKLVFDTETGAREAMQFFKKPEDYAVVPEVGKPLSLLAHVEQSFFMGRMQTRLKIVDIF